MKRYTVLFLVMAYLMAGCSISARTPTPGIPLTGNTLTPTMTSTPLFQPASPPASTLTPPQNSALLFDGEDDYVMVADDPSLDLPDAFTIAAWIYLEEYTEWASLVTKGDKPNINNYAIHQSGPYDPVYGTEFGRIRFSGCVGLRAPLPESQTVLSLRKWHFVAVTFDGLRISFYSNGIPDGVFDVRGPLCTNDQPFYIGVDFPLTTEYWHGAIDELRIWSLPLSASQILDVMNGSQTPLEEALVGYWAFDEGSGLVAHDGSLHANDGLLVGDPAWVSPGAPVGQ